MRDVQYEKKNQQRTQKQADQEGKLVQLTGLEGRLVLLDTSRQLVHDSLRGRRRFVLGFLIGKPFAETSQVLFLRNSVVVPGRHRSEQTLLLLSNPLVLFFVSNRLALLLLNTL